MALSTDIARAILDGFDKHYRLFRETSHDAKSRFERSDWAAVVEAQRHRIGMYDQRVIETVQAIRTQFPVDYREDAIFRQVKLEYIGMLYEAEHKQPECAETFFNSVARRLLDRRYYNNRFIFDRSALSTEHPDLANPAYRSYYPNSSDLRDSFRQILTSFDLNTKFKDLHRDLDRIAKAIEERYPNGWDRNRNFQIQILGSLFFRNKSAYAVGRIINGGDVYPVVVPLLKDDAGRVYVDTILLDPLHVGRVLSLGRAYMMVDMEVPAAYVDFLASLVPTKPRAELYTLVGLQKQGKTLFFRDLRQHLRHSSDTFVLAPGTKGMVMVVFTLPSYPYVFKVIRDSFAPPKDSDRALVEAKYDFVKQNDRVGRMADTLEFAHVALPKHRLDASVLNELKALVPSQLEFVDADSQGTSSTVEPSVVIKHLYIERRLVPLDIFLESAGDEAKRAAIVEYGNAIRELASANIFPGDLLLKNFGITRYGRVLFYDYDEICELSECRFRTLPTPRNEEEVTAGDPWFAVEKNDVFPEQFPTFLVPPGLARDTFLKRHLDLTSATYWCSLQARTAAGVQDELLPYDEEIRFSRRFAASG